MRQRFIVDNLSLLSQALNGVVNLDGIPVEHSIGYEAEATGLVHDFLVVSGRGFSLICKESPAWQFVAVFSLVELQLYGSAQFRISQVAQNVFCLDDTPQMGERLGLTAMVSEHEGRQSPAGGAPVAGQVCISA